MGGKESAARMTSLGTSQTPVEQITKAPPQPVSIAGFHGAQARVQKLTALTRYRTAQRQTKPRSL